MSIFAILSGQHMLDAGPLVDVKQGCRCKASVQGTWARGTYVSDWAPELIQQIKFRQNVFPGRKRSGLVKIPGKYEGFNSLASDELAKFFEQQVKEVALMP